MSKVNMGILPSTQNTISVLLDSVCAVTALITNCDKSQIATVVSQFVTVAICDGSNTTFQIDVNCARRYTPKCRKDVHINIGPYQEGFPCTSIMGFITDINTNRCTSEITPESANMKLFIFMSKVNMGTLPSTHNTFSVLLKSVCHVTALLTNCDTTAAIYDCRNL